MVGSISPASTATGVGSRGTMSVVQTPLQPWQTLKGAPLKAFCPEPPHQQLASGVLLVGVSGRHIISVNLSTWNVFFLSIFRSLYLSEYNRAHSVFVHPIRREDMVFVSISEPHQWRLPLFP